MRPHILLCFPQQFFLFKPAPWISGCGAIVCLADSVTHGAGLWITAPQQGGVFIATSPDGVNWDATTVGYALAAGPNSFFIAGYFGMIMESGPFVSPPAQISLEMLKTIPPVISISAPEFHGYEIQTSDDLQSPWIPLGSVSNFSAITHLPVPAATNSNARLYRVKSLD
jgi:hypothetical protein